MNLVTAAANRRASPQYSAHRPATARGGGDGLFTTEVVPTVVADGFALTPNVNEPAVVWPSSSETVRHVTVYTPFGTDRTSIWSARGLPGTGRTRPLV